MDKPTRYDVKDHGAYWNNEDGDWCRALDVEKLEADRDRIQAELYRTIKHREEFGAARDRRARQVDVLQQQMDECTVAAGSHGVLPSELPRAIEKLRAERDKAEQELSASRPTLHGEIARLKNVLRDANQSYCKERDSLMSEVAQLSHDIEILKCERDEYKESYDRQGLKRGKELEEHYQARKQLTAERDALRAERDRLMAASRDAWRLLHRSVYGLDAEESKVIDSDADQATFTRVEERKYGYRPAAEPVNPTTEMLKVRKERDDLLEACRSAVGWGYGNQARLGWDVLIRAIRNAEREK